MTDTKAPTPWYSGLMPYVGQALVAVVSAAIGAGGTLWASGGLRVTASPPAPKVDVVKTVPEAGSLMQRLAAVEDRFGQFNDCTNAVHVLRAELAMKGERRPRATATIPAK